MASPVGSSAHFYAPRFYSLYFGSLDPYVLALSRVLFELIFVDIYHHFII